MTAVLVQHQGMIRFLVFVGVLLVLLLAQRYWPRRRRSAHTLLRLGRHMSLSLLGNGLIRLLLPVPAIAVAIGLTTNPWGVFHSLVWPAWLEVLLCLLILDVAIYWQHRVSHQWPWLWRLHRVHHSDVELDVTTALRFHPVELCLSMGFKCLLVWLLGAPVLAVLLFELLLNGMAMFNHANLALPKLWDARLRCLIITPDVHRVHHSPEVGDTNSNYGFSLSCWDRCFGSWRPGVASGVEADMIGLEQYRQPTDHRLWHLLRQPLDR